MARPCMNPASVIFPERDEPFEEEPRRQRTRRGELMAREAGLDWWAFERSARAHRDPKPFNGEEESD